MKTSRLAAKYPASPINPPNPAKTAARPYRPATPVPTAARPPSALSRPDPEVTTEAGIGKLYLRRSHA
jgi:hypothetical protein